MKKQLSMMIEGTCEECPWCQCDEDGCIECSNPDIKGKNDIDVGYNRNTHQNIYPPILPNCPLPDAP